MIRKAAKAITRDLVKINLISEQDEDIYLYGIKQFLDLIVNFFSTVVIGLFFNMVWQSIVFSIVYIPLRRYAGGYHAPNPNICYLLSTTLIVISLFAIKQIKVTWQIFLSITIISIILIFIKAPVESRNKPLDIKEKEVYKRYARIIAVLEGFLAGTFFIVGWMELCMCILITLCIVSLLLFFPDDMNKHS